VYKKAKGKKKSKISSAVSILGVFG